MYYVYVYINRYLSYYIYLFFYVSVSFLHEVSPPNGICLSMVEMNIWMESEVPNHSSKWVY